MTHLLKEVSVTYKIAVDTETAAIAASNLAVQKLLGRHHLSLEGQREITDEIKKIFDRAIDEASETVE